MTDKDREKYTGKPLDVATLDALAQRAEVHPLVDDWTFQPDSMSPRRLELHLDVDQYPMSIDTARLDIRWFEGGDYTVHYLETCRDEVWQCRWDRHPKPGAPRVHFHPPPDTSTDVEPSRNRVDVSPRGTVRCPRLGHGAGPTTTRKLTSAAA